MKKLMTIPGIGNWTAQYIAMRTMQWTDAFLETKKFVGNRKIRNFVRRRGIRNRHGVTGKARGKRIFHCRSRS